MITLYKPHQNIALTKHVEAKLKALDETTVIQSKTFANGNKPLPKDDYLPTYIESLHFSHQVLIDYINQELQAEATRFQVVLTGNATDDDVTALDEQLKTKNNRLNEAEIKLYHTPVPKKWKHRKLAYLFIIALCLSEGIMAINGFTAFGISAIGATIMGIALAFCLAAFAHTIPKLIAEGKNALQKRTIAISITLLTFYFFFYLSQTRSNYLIQTTGIEYSPWPFVFTSVFLMLIAIAVARYYLPNPQEKEAIDHYKHLCKEKQGLQNEVNTLQAEIAKKNTYSQITKTSGASILEYGNMLEQQIINHAHKNYSDFKAINLNYRTDNAHPTCFQQPYPFQFNRHFVFTPKTEQNP